MYWILLLLPIIYFIKYNYFKKQLILPDYKNIVSNIKGLQTIIISKDNKILFEYGNTNYYKHEISSCRKSVIAILYGMYPINLDKTLKELNIDDKQGLSEIEKTATIRDLLSSKSGIYHPASNKGDDPNKPNRHSKKPKEYFIYNNWDFNALGTIFIQETGVNIYDALNDLGNKIGFEDFDLEFNKEEYNKRKEQITESIHPPYHMFISARDMVKIGYLMLNKGKYNKKQIIPEEWVNLITTIHTTSELTKKRDGYGYLWWTFDENIEHPLYKAYSAKGFGGQSITVVPKSNMVIVTKNHLDFVRLIENIFKIKSN
jgi:hypothetical protein